MKNIEQQMKDIKQQLIEQETKKVKQMNNIEQQIEQQAKNIQNIQELLNSFINKLNISND